MTERGWKTRAVVLSQQHDEAGGSLNRETPVKVASSPDNDGTDQHYRMVRVRLARGEGVREKPVSKPLKFPASSNPMDSGWSAMRTNTVAVLGTSGLVKVADLGGHGESLRRNRGDIAGA